MLLKLSNLTVEFDTDDGVVHAVNDVSLELSSGETLGLVGESGCGKSVTAMSIPRLVPSPPGRVVSGKIEFNGEDLLSASFSRLRQIRGADIGVIFQEPMTALSPLHHIGDQLMETIALHRKLSKREQYELSLHWLERVGIAAPKRCMESYPYELSGGMRQRVMIAMAMLLEPRLVIADEPTTALDVTIQAQILDLLKEVTNDENSAQERAVLLITHDMGVIWQMCTRVIVMYASRIVEEAPVKELFAHPAHPYTRALMNSIPALHATADDLSAIPGSVPSLLNPPKGCPFAARCSFARPECYTSLPQRRELSPRHWVSCNAVK
jgi:oligopeptide/dipeptide ABC transporter ATP-binding protein